MVDKKSLFRGRKLRELLELKGLSQKEAADLCDIDQGTVSNWIKGKVNPSPDMVYKLCEGLRVHYSYFYNDDDIPLQTLDLPDDLKRFVMESDSLDYLRLVRKAKLASIPPEALDNLIEALKMVHLL